MQLDSNHWSMSQKISIMFTKWEVWYVRKNIGKNVSIWKKTQSKGKHIRIKVFWFHIYDIS